MQTLPNWAWLLIGAVGGYALAHAGGKLGARLSFSVGARASGPPPGSYTMPADQPDGGGGTYQEIGAYNPLFSAGFPDVVTPGDATTIVDGGAIS